MSKSKKFKAIPIAAVVIVAALVVGILVFRDALFPQDYTRSFLAMDTAISLRLSGKGAQSTAETIEAFVPFLDESVLSAYSENSEVSKINRNGGGKVQNDALSSYINTLPQYLPTLMSLAEKSDGAFDPTLGRLISLWNIGGENARVPEKYEIHSILGQCGYKNLSIEGNDIILRSSVQLNLGAAGKGIACDEIKKILNVSKCDSAVAAVGGSILLWSTDKSKTFSVGIRDPRGASDEYIAVLELGNCCVSTSGDYERYFTDSDGTVYHHILNPTTGYPVSNGVISVTVVSDSGLLSDALSTACFVLGFQKSLPLLESYGAQAVFITSDKSVRCTGDIAEKLTLNGTAYSLAE